MPGLIKKLLLAGAVVVALALPAHAAASVGSIYGDYTKDGSIDGCDYSPADLNGALGAVPTDVAQYDPRFVDSLNKALANRSCGAGGGGAAATGTATGAGPGNGPGQATAPDGSLKPTSLTGTEAPAPDSNLDSNRGFPAALAVLAGLVALILLGTGAVALARNKGWSPGGEDDGSVTGMRATLSDYYWGLRDQLGR